MIAFIRESNVLVKHFDGKHQKSHVKSPAKSCNFTDRKGYEPLCFLGSSVRQNFDPTFVKNSKFSLPFSTPTGSNVEDIPAALHVGQQTEVLPTMPRQNLL